MTRLQENLEKLKVQGSEDDSEEKVDSSFDQKFRKNRTVLRCPRRNFGKFGYTLRGCPLFRKFRERTENGVPFTTGNIQKFKSDFFFVEWKAPLVSWKVILGF